MFFAHSRPHSRSTARGGAFSVQREGDVSYLGDLLPDFLGQGAVDGVGLPANLAGTLAGVKALLECCFVP